MLLRVALILLLGGVAIGAWAALVPHRTPAQLEAVAGELVAGIHVSATVVGSSLAATEGIADFGIGKGLRLVRVRIVDELAIELRIDAVRDVLLAELPRFCLVGPFAAPDDAGLSDRCWGEPDLAASVSARLPTDGSGNVAVHVGQPVIVAVVLHRGDVRCDYPPGKWVLEIEANPLIDGAPAGARSLPNVSLVVPWATDGPLALRQKTRYCGLANGPYLEQGEPSVKSP